MSQTYQCDQCGASMPPELSNQVLVVRHREGTTVEGMVDAERDLCDQCVERLARVLHAHGLPTVAEMVDESNPFLRSADHA